MVSTLVQDLTFAFRQLQKNPGRMLVAVAVLALGLGANAAIFSVVDAVLLQPLPYPDPDRLAGLYERDVIGEEPYNSVAPANYLDWRRQTHQFQEIAASGEDRFNLSSPSNDFVPERVDGSFISDNLLTALGVHPQLGRNFLGAEDRPGAARVALISNALWQRRFGGSSG